MVTGNPYETSYVPDNILMLSHVLPKKFTMVHLYILYTEACICLMLLKSL